MGLPVGLIVPVYAETPREAVPLAIPAEGAVGVGL